MKNFIHKFENGGSTLLDKTWDEIKCDFVSQKMPKGSILLMQGDVSDKLYFVNSGAVRGYYEWSGKEYTSWFAHDKQFACSIRSFFTQTPSVETIHLLEETELCYFRYRDTEGDDAASCRVNELMQLITEQYLLLYESRVRMLRGMSAQERWDVFTTNYPELYRRVSLQHIASYLDLTPSTISRLRKPKKHLI